MYLLQKNKDKEKDRDKDRDEVDRGGDKERGRIHQFVATSFSNSTMCDCCGKSLVNKPAFQCTGETDSIERRTLYSTSNGAYGSEL